jgi:membrane protein DedA with SNARE-associated domain
MSFSPEPLGFLTATVLATFVSEDLTCVTVGLLIAAGGVSPWLGLAACALGIFLGDLGLWLLGRLSREGALRWSWLKRRLPQSRLEGLGQWLDAHCGQAVLAARFLPGTRFPLYVAAGALGRDGGRFALWALVASLLWVPLLVGSVALFGEALAGPLRDFAGQGWPGWLLVALLGYSAYRTALLSCSRVGRAKLAARVSRLWRWEFWPTWLFYLPLLPWLAWLSLRHRGLLVWTACNPGIPAGGVVGESKHAILTQLAPERVVPSALLPSSDISERLRYFLVALSAFGWQYPLILKPDSAQRGAGVKRVRDLVEVEKYLRRHAGATLVQPYNPGPFEAGVFYYRLPGEERGHIFSITDKEFPVLTGDGRATLEELIWRHPRYRMQAGIFLARHAAQADRVLADGETMPLAMAGNHSQGTMFRDGSHLLTPELERAVDEVVRPFAGFFVGRFDVRYSDADEFKAGRDLAVVELNGATSESTNLYDPSWSLFRAYRTLFRQWELLYRIGAANRRLGHEPATVRTLLRCVFDYYRGPRIDPLAD